MVQKIRVLFSSQFYPLFIGKYFLRALKRNPTLDVKSAGIYTGSWIPWKGGMTLPDKYANPPDYVLPFKPGTHIRVAYELVKPAFPEGWVPDLVLTVDAGMNWNYKPSDGVVVSVGTDGHCLNDWYQHSRSVSDYFYNMHPCYHMPGDNLISYAYDPSVHYPMSDVVKDTDAVLIGMDYEQRVQWVNALRASGVSVIFENGPIMDEYREVANRARIGLNWPSMDDTNARVFETMAMNLCLVTKRTPDLNRYGFEDGKHYLGFSTHEEAVEKVLFAKNNPELAEAIALSGYQKVTWEEWTYDKLVKDILKEAIYA